jgi:hypothetical protein
MTIKVPLDTMLKLLPGKVPSYYKGRKCEAGNVPVVDVADAHLLPKQVVDSLKAAAIQDAKTRRVPGCVFALSLIRKVARYQNHPDAGNRMVGDLDDLFPTLRDAVDQSSRERHWLYREMGDGNLCPAYVANIERKPYRGWEYPAHVLVTLVWLERSKKRKMKVSFFRSDVSELLEDDKAVGSGTDTQEAVSVAVDDDEEDGEKPEKKPKARRVKRKLCEVLQAKRLFLEDPELYRSYKASIPQYSDMSGRSGQVKKAVGTGFFVSQFKSYRDEVEYNLKAGSLEQDEVAAEIVMDDQNSESIPFKTTCSFWDLDRTGGEDEYDIPKYWQSRAVALPFHPYLLCFDLRRQSHVFVHVDNVRERQHDSSALGKLVLPQSDKDFITMLMGAAGAKLEDIIVGKAGGVFILSEGEPGTGKTLTAEVYAEQMKKPLYTVQCSQLGIEPEQIEEKLRLVLARAQRWGAVLLLDEADVYIRSRGVDVRHNAIVGVMLRVIEYYNGLLFMTTNVSDIDDAICSRATAHVVYKRPGPDLLPQIWRVLSQQFKFKLTGAEVESLSKRWPNAVGRDVKNLIKLAKLSTVASNAEHGAATVVKVAKYLDMERNKA